MQKPPPLPSKPHWLQGMLGPTVMLWVFVLTFGIASGMASGGELPDRAHSISVLLNLLIAAWWVVADSRKRGRRLVYDYGLFLALAWPVVVPVYLFQTRGWKAFLTILCYVGMWIASSVLAGLILALREG